MTGKEEREALVAVVREHRGERNAARTPRAPGARRK